MPLRHNDIRATDVSADVNIEPPGFSCLAPCAAAPGPRPERVGACPPLQAMDRQPTERDGGDGHGPASYPQPSAGGPQTLGQEGDLGAVARLELFHDRADMHLDRALTHVELIGDQLVGHPLAQGAGDGQLFR